METPKRYEYIIEFEPNVLRNDETSEICMKSKKITELVRCKDCEWWFGKGKKNGVASCAKDALIRDCDFFCANGQKDG